MAKGNKADEKKAADKSGKSDMKAPKDDTKSSKELKKLLKDAEKAEKEAKDAVKKATKEATKEATKMVDLETSEFESEQLIKQSEELTDHECTKQTVECTESFTTHVGRSGAKESSHGGQQASGSSAPPKDIDLRQLDAWKNSPTGARSQQTDHRCTHQIVECFDSCDSHVGRDGPGSKNLTTSQGRGGQSGKNLSGQEHEDITQSSRWPHLCSLQLGLPCDSE